MELKDYLKGQEFESKQFEFKEMVSHKNYERWAKTFSAFANSDGGKILFGVDDDGRAVGIEKETLKQDILYINDICDKMIFPRISYEVEKIKLEDGSFVLVVDVAKSQKRPVWLRRTDGEEVIYVRRDGESVIAHGDQIEDLVLANKREPFDGVVTEKRFSDVTFSKLEEYFKENAKEDGKITEKLLVSKEAMSPQRLFDERRAHFRGWRLHRQLQCGLQDLARSLQRFQRDARSEDVSRGSPFHL